MFEGKLCNSNAWVRELFVTSKLFSRPVPNNVKYVLEWKSVPKIRPMTYTHVVQNKSFSSIVHITSDHCALSAISLTHEKCKNCVGEDAGGDRWGMNGKNCIDATISEVMMWRVQVVVLEYFIWRICIAKKCFVKWLLETMGNLSRSFLKCLSYSEWFEWLNFRTLLENGARSIQLMQI